MLLLFREILLLNLVFSLCAAAVTALECDPSRYICSGKCPPIPEGFDPPTSEAICSKDPETDTCICWISNPSSQLNSLFQCEARVNGSVSKLTCIPPSHCFRPDPNPVCMIVLHCPCLLHEPRHQKSKTWQRVKAVVHTMRKPDPKNRDGHLVEKIQGDVREFSLKHLIFLVGFVIAPLLCWCLLNFFHEGKCRKKPRQPPEAQPIPTARMATIDNMNIDERENHGDDTPAVPAIVVCSSPTESQPVFRPLPSAPEDLEAMLQATDTHQQTLLKCESPPPYCESADRNYQVDYGPPPAYDEAVRGSDINVQQLWQSVFIVDPGTRENA